jgi:hypothetical protein
MLYIRNTALALLLVLTPGSSGQTVASQIRSPEQAGFSYEETVVVQSLIPVYSVDKMLTTTTANYQIATRSSVRSMLEEATTERGLQFYPPNLVRAFGISLVLSGLGVIGGVAYLIAHTYVAALLGSFSFAVGSFGIAATLLKGEQILDQS